MKELIFIYKQKDYSDYVKDSFCIKRVLGIILKDHIIPSLFLSLIISLDFTNRLFGAIDLKHWLFVFIIVFSLTYFLALTILFFGGGKTVQKQHNGICKDVKLIINDDKINFDNGSIQSVYNWSSVKDIYNVKNNFLIFVADIQGIIIPKRIFNSDIEICECWEYLQTCYCNAHNNV